MVKNPLFIIQSKITAHNEEKNQLKLSQKGEACFGRFVVSYGGSEIDKLVLKFIWKLKRPGKIKTILLK